MKVSRAAILALIVPVGLAAQQPPAGPPAQPITAAFRGRMMNLHRILPQAFDSIPESKFSFKPTPAQQSIGFIAAHLATDNYFFCSNFGDMKPTRPAKATETPDSLKASWPKDTLVAQLKESVAFCQQAFAQLNDASLAEQITYRFGSGPERQAARVNMILGHVMDMADHYSQLANYMRLNNMLPPTALPRPRPGGN